MEMYEPGMKEEGEYLESTLSFLMKQIEEEAEELGTRKSRLIEARRAMWEDSAHYSRDFAKLTEMNQYLTEVLNQTAGYSSAAKKLERYKKMLEAPYFGRFDFVERGFEDEDRIYIGLHSIMDPKTHDIYVYDWRAPISSIFYRYELGEAAYEAPQGEVSGNVTLKRQYKIQNSRLKYFFDCSIKIDDEMLQAVLSRNASAKMRNIVETIQKEQDIIIRDTENELLIAQGVAGSGKTSIALHRIAFMIYNGLNSGLGSENILILSPNDVFSRYISSVLPELGEENVPQETFEDMLHKLLGDGKVIQNRGRLLESMIKGQHRAEAGVERQSIGFKCSRQFAVILDRLLDYWARNMVDFQDIYYDGKTVESRHRLRSFFLNNRVNMPMAQKLRRIEGIIFDKLHPLQKERLVKIEKKIQGMEGHDFDVKPFSRLMALKETKALASNIRKFTELDCMKLYKTLYEKPRLLYKLAEGIELPPDVEGIISMTKENLYTEQIKYEDAVPLAYLKLQLEGGSPYAGVKQLVIDEAQDYYPLQYEILKRLFPYAGYTIVGDTHQAIEKEASFTIYDEIVGILNKKKSVKLFLNKSYRSSYEINMFNQRLQAVEQDFTSFERHEQQPSIIHAESADRMFMLLENAIKKYIGQGYGSVAVICKTRDEAEAVYGGLRTRIEIKLVDSYADEVEKGVVAIPAYMAKGMEFDAVLVYEVNNENYCTELDRKLLYIACSRALHRLELYYTGQISPYLE